MMGVIVKATRPQNKQGVKKSIVSTAGEEKEERAAGNRPFD